MNREKFIGKLSEVQQTVDRLLAQLQASEYDKFAAHLYRSRREYRSICERAGNRKSPRTNSGHCLRRFSVPLLPNARMESFAARRL
jgi:hypothetical protein